MKKTRHHYVPRALLNRFASWSDVDRGKFKIWRYTRDSTPIEVSTKDVAVKKKFYGDTEELEDNLSAEEGVIADVFRRIKSGEDIELFSVQLSRFLWLQSFRTFAFRARFGDLMKGGMDELHKSVGDQNFISKANDKLLSTVYEKVSGASLYEYLEMLDHAKFIGLDVYLRAQIYQRAIAIDLSDQMKTYLGYIADDKFIKDCVRTAFNENLLEILRNETIPNIWYLKNWKVVTYEEDIVLGDCCVLAGSCGGDIGPICDANKWEFAMLPIDDRTCLIGYKSISPDILTAHELNVLSAQSSTDEFYSSKSDPHCAELTACIGSNTGYLSDDDLAQIYSEFWK